MKISDEELSELIKQHQGTCFYDENVLTTLALKELQQHREEKRWRDVMEEEPYAGLEYQVKGGSYVYHHVFVYKGDGIFECQGYRTSYQAGRDITHWRPLPTDLPEE